MKAILLKISDLTFDSKLYPRMHTHWQTVYQYAQAMRAGEVFPPITVGLYQKKQYPVDGWHRIGARKLLKEEYIDAYQRKFEDVKAMFAEGVRLNSQHGRQLSVQEKVRIIDKLEGWNFTVKEISEIVKVPVDKIDIFKARIVTGPNGKPVYLKSLTAKAGITTSINQTSFNVRTVTHLLVQLVTLLENKDFTIETDEEKTLATQAYSLLGEKLELTGEAS